MKNLAIIAEYNPFHNGHLHHLNCAKELTQSDYGVALMSGNFLQRGTPAMWDKYTRAKAASASGIDVVLELPFVYSTGSAKDFAAGAVNILDKLNSIDYLCFGAETDNLYLLEKIADIINIEPKTYKEQLTNALNSGCSFPQARTIALNHYFDSNSDLKEIIKQPNNILAIEYIASLKNINSKIKPVLIERHKAMYHDKLINDDICSATAIRNNILDSNYGIEHIKTSMPDTTWNIIKDNYLKSWPIDSDDLTPFLQSKLIMNDSNIDICDISEDFANKLKKLSPITTYEDAINDLSSKNLTSTRICRNLIHLILDYKKAHRNQFIENGYALYSSILSFKKESTSLIKHMSNHSQIPLITKKADYELILSKYPNIDINLAKTMWSYDIKASNLYNCLIYNKYQTIMSNDYSTKLPII